MKERQIAPVVEWAVELEPGVYLAPWEGDPGRTLDLSNAQRFASLFATREAIAEARKMRPFMGARAVPVSPSQEGKDNE